jgi:hypothetical protein
VRPGGGWRVVARAHASWRTIVAALVRRGASKPPRIGCPRATPGGGWGVEASPLPNELRRPASHARGRGPRPGAHHPVLPDSTRLHSVPHHAGRSRRSVPWGRPGGVRAGSGRGSPRRCRRRRRPGGPARRRSRRARASPDPRAVTGSPRRSRCSRPPADGPRASRAPRRSSRPPHRSGSGLGPGALSIPPPAHVRWRVPRPRHQPALTSIFLPFASLDFGK